MAENAQPGEGESSVAVGAPVTATDRDEDDADTLTYSLSGTDAARFDIASGSGQITVKSATTLDHEAKSSYEVTVGVTDGKDGKGVAEATPVIDDTTTVTISVTDVDEAPDAPARPTVSGASLTSVTVGWKAPDVTGKPALTDYDVRWFKGADDPTDAADWVEPGETGGHDHAGTATDGDARRARGGL